MDDRSCDSYKMSSTSEESEDGSDDDIMTDDESKTMDFRSYMDGRVPTPYTDGDHPYGNKHLMTRPADGMARCVHKYTTIHSAAFKGRWSKDQYICNGGRV